MSGKDERFAELSARVAKDYKRLRIPGVSLGVWDSGAESIACFGKTSVENPLAVTPDTMFQIGSITKTMTATALAMLADRGAIDIDAPVRAMMPGFSMADPDVGARLTCRHLLTHTGGWVGDYFDGFGDGDDALATMVARIGRLPQVTPLGAHFSYNNAGFNIASRLLEIAAGKPYEAAIRDMLFGPLGLERSFFYPSDVLITHRFAVGHETVKRKATVCRPWAIGRAGNGVGGGVLSIRDLLAYARMHLRSGLSDSGARVAPAAAIEAMREPLVDAGARGHVGLSWFIKDIGGVRFVSHGGATSGQQAYLAFVPGRDFAVAVLTNSDDGGIVTDKLRAWAAELWFGVSDPEPLPIAAAGSRLDELAGAYELPISAFTLERKGDGLLLTDIPRGGFPTPDSPPGEPTPPIRGAIVPGDRLVFLDEPRKGAIADIIRGPDGRVAFMRLGGRVHPKLASPEATRG